MRGWLQSAPHDHLTLQSIAVSGDTSTNSLPVLPPRLLKLDPEADLILVFVPEVTDAPGVSNLASLVVSRVVRHGIQPVVALADKTPLSRRQLSELGLSGTYFLSENPERNLADWGRILGQTWHCD